MMGYHHRRSVLMSVEPNCLETLSTGMSMSWVDDWDSLVADRFESRRWVSDETVRCQLKTLGHQQMCLILG